MHYNRGFTLLEVIIYTALLSVLLTGAVVTSYELVRSSEHTAGISVVQQEGSFVLRKFTWALADATTTPAIAGGGCDQMLIVATSTGKGQIQFDRNAGTGAIEMSEGNNAPAAITTANVDATCLSFTSTAGVPAGITIQITISSSTFTLTNYVRS